MNCNPPLTSPTANTFSTAVWQNSSTTIVPFGRNSMSVFSNPNPSVLARRPVACNTASNSNGPYFSVSTTTSCPLLRISFVAVPSLNSIPASSKYPWASSAISLSSLPKIPGAKSITVTLTPRRAYRLANSNPMLPPPIIPRVLGAFSNFWNSVLSKSLRHL